MATPKFHGERMFCQGDPGCILISPQGRLKDGAETGGSSLIGHSRIAGGMWASGVEIRKGGGFVRCEDSDTGIRRRDNAIQIDQCHMPLADAPRLAGTCRMCLALSKYTSIPHAAIPDYYPSCFSIVVFTSNLQISLRPRAVSSIWSHMLFAPLFPKHLCRKIGKGIIIDRHFTHVVSEL